MSDFGEQRAALLEQLYSSSSDSDDEFMDVLCASSEKRTIPKIKIFITDVLDKYDDDEFKKQLRVSKSTFHILVEMFESSEYWPKNTFGKCTKSPKTHIAAFLWFAGNRCVLRTVAQIFDTSISTMFVIIERVMSFLISIGSKIIKFPDTVDDKESISAEFKKIAGIPGALGCIDGTYIPIRTPARKVKSTYINRHDQTSITLQGICDHKKRFTDAFTGPSSKMHDATVFRKSFIKNKILTLGNKYHIIGDSAYPISENLLTPYRDYGNLSQIQEHYNYKFSKTRVLIENAFGLLKGRFRQLMKIEFWGVEKTSRFVLCCCILHNLCIDNDDFMEGVVEEQAPPEEPLYNEEVEILLKRLGEIKRDNIAREIMI